MIHQSSKVIRREFIEYFKARDHIFIPPSPVLPLFDTSVAFINAGMNQFKSVFLGQTDPPALRVTNYQKCIRIGGKHNDLDTVGHDNYHHTFFEMLGNWSFQAYGKEDACTYAWNALTQLFGLNKDHLYVTYFGGDSALGIKPDLACRDVWLKLGVPKSRVIPLGIRENFWEMSLTGPCGPCTEIHLDIGKTERNLKELWNIVFIESQRLKDGSIVPLNKQYVDTGMGFERLVAILQGKDSNYDTDLFQPLFDSIHRNSGAPEYSGKFGNNSEIDTGYRTLADHARMITVALADGIIPEKNYKLRRILRKALSIESETFKCNNLVEELTYQVSEILGEVYPEIPENLKKIQTILKHERELYRSLKASLGQQWQTLVEINPALKNISDPFATGLFRTYEALQSAVMSNKDLRIIPGEMAFKMYDLFGTQLELIEELAEHFGLSVDIDSFHVCCNDLKLKSRSQSTPDSSLDVSTAVLNSLQEKNVPVTNDSFKYDYIFDATKYQFPKLKSKIIAVILNDEFVQTASVKMDIKPVETTRIGILLDKTLFYATEGGQLSDKGFICINGRQFHVTHVQKTRGYVIHHGFFDNTDNKNVEITAGMDVDVEIDGIHRVGLMKHHTATHLLNSALRSVVPVIAQRGSVVKHDNLVFRFSTFGLKLGLQHVRSLEVMINKCIKAKVPIRTKIVDSFGLMAEKNLILIPGEIYPEKNLRIVEINGPDLISKEACCGTHVHNTGVLDNFSIVEITSKGSSSCTIVAATGSQAKLPVKCKKPSILNFDGPNRREVIKSYMMSEIDRAIHSTTDPFVIHCLESPIVDVESIPLQIVFENCPDTPIFVIVRSSRKARARCFVPQDYQSSSFNAQLWMQSITEVLPLKLGSFKDEDPSIISHTKILKLPGDQIMSLTTQAMMQARKFALQHIKKSCTQSQST